MTPSEAGPPRRAQDESELRLRDTWDGLWRRRRVVAVLALCGGALAALHAALAPPPFRATAQILIEREEPSVVSFKTVTEVNERGWAEEFYHTQVRLLRSRTLARQAVRGLDLLQHPEFGGPRPPAEVEQALRAPEGASPLVEQAVDRFGERLGIGWVRLTRVVAVTFESSDPVLAARAANTTAELYVQHVHDSRARIAGEAARWLAGQVEEQRRRLEAAEAALRRLPAPGGAGEARHEAAQREVEALKGLLGGLTSRLKEVEATQALRASNLRVVDPASVPARRTASRRGRVLLGALLGLVGGLALAFVLERLDDRVRTPDQVRWGVGARLLAVIPEGPVHARTPLGRPEGRAAEAYRVLRAGLGSLLSPEGPHAVLVTSTTAGEGKTTVAAGLAACLAAQGGRVLLADADLRSPAAHELIGVPPGPGLADVAAGAIEPGAAVRRVEGGPLDFLGAGTARGAEAADLVSPASIRRVLDALRPRYAWIVIDSPPVGPLADALVIAPLVDAVVVVLRGGLIPEAGVARTLDRLQEAGAGRLGVVLNRAPVDEYPGQYSFHYGHGSPDAAPARASTPS